MTILTLPSLNFPSERGTRSGRAARGRASIRRGKREGLGQFPPLNPLSTGPAEARVGLIPQLPLSTSPQLCLSHLKYRVSDSASPHGVIQLLRRINQHF